MFIDKMNASLHKLLATQPNKAEYKDSFLPSKLAINHLECSIIPLLDQTNVTCHSIIRRKINPQFTIDF